MKPDASTYNPDPQYLRDLVLSIPMTRVKLAATLGIHERTLRLYMSGTRRFTYSTQFMLECLVLEP
jgi:hypothetical protein